MTDMRPGRQAGKKFEINAGRYNLGLSQGDYVEIHCARGNERVQVVTGNFINHLDGWWLLEHFTPENRSATRQYAVPDEAVIYISARIKEPPPYEDLEQISTEPANLRKDAS